MPRPLLCKSVLGQFSQAIFQKTKNNILATKIEIKLLLLMLHVLLDIRVIRPSLFGPSKILEFEEKFPLTYFSYMKTCLPSSGSRWLSENEVRWKKVFAGCDGLRRLRHLPAQRFQTFKPNRRHQIW